MLHGDESPTRNKNNELLVFRLRKPSGRAGAVKAYWRITMDMRQLNEDSLVQKVLTRALSMVGATSREDVLGFFLESTIELTRARYGALGLLDNAGNTIDFMWRGIPEEAARRIGAPPVGKGLFQRIPDRGYYISNDIASQREGITWPPGHPVMENFLGAPVLFGDRILGRVYLADKNGGFTRADGRIIELLGNAAGVALGHIRRYEEVESVGVWGAALQDASVGALTAKSTEEGIDNTLGIIRKASGSDSVTLFMRGPQGWIPLGSSGVMRADIMNLPPVRSQQLDYAAASQTGGEFTRLVDEDSTAVFTRLGPVMVVPGDFEGGVTGVLVCFRHRGAERYHEFVPAHVQSFMAHLTDNRMLVAEALEGAGGSSGGLVLESSAIEQGVKREDFDFYDFTNGDAPVEMNSTGTSMPAISGPNTGTFRPDQMPQAYGAPSPDDSLVAVRDSLARQGTVSQQLLDKLDHAIYSIRS